jgi:HK97 family phage portal protein
MSMWRRAYTNPRTAASAGMTRRDFEGVPGASLPGGGLNLPPRSSGKHGAVNVTEAKAMTHSAYFACLRLRADLVSTFPADVFRDVDLGDGPVATEMPKPPVMVDPGGVEWDFTDWMWASQRDLDSTGNAIGLIRERNAVSTRYYPEGLPSRIELFDTRGCSIINHKGSMKYRIDGRIYDPSQVYHERQYRMSGSPVGLSPLMMAAATIGEYLSMQEYGLDWFSHGGIPKAWMQNTAKRLGDEERTAAKSWYEDTVRNGDLMVTGRDWEYNMIQAETAGLEWLEGRRYGIAEVCRFLSVPPEMVHGAVSGQSVTYANVTQANLQFLIMHLAPAVIRREKNLTKLLPMPRYVKLNTDALLRMDPKTRQDVLTSQLGNWQLTLSEARKLDNRQALSTADMAEMTKIYGAPQIGKGPAAPAPDPASGTTQPDQGDAAPAVPADAMAWTDTDMREAAIFAERMEALAELTAA